MINCITLLRFAEVFLPALHRERATIEPFNVSGYSITGSSNSGCNLASHFHHSRRHRKAWEACVIEILPTNECDATMFNRSYSTLYHNNLSIYRSALRFMQKLLRLQAVICATKFRIKTEHLPIQPS
jgi:hypothetical protein